MTHKVKVSNLTDQVTAVLNTRIAEGQLSAGSRLPTEQDLSVEFGVSRTVVREAISRLKSEGLVETRQGAGGFVATSKLGVPFRIATNSVVSPQATAEILELRLAVEAEAAALAAERADRAQLKAIRDALHAVAAAVACGGDGLNEDLHFHRCIVKAAGNRHYIDLAQFLERHARHQIEITGGRAARIGRVPQAQLAHEAIYKAIAARDPDRARKCAREHFRLGIQRIKKMATTG
jgi:GntR family transcriptional regulator, transcriptional repressor for pyruvate dehydrogenase complex